MKSKKLEDKLYKIFCANKRMNKIIIVYKYPQVIQLKILKYEPVPIINDENIEITFSTVSSHLCLPGAQLYKNIQFIEDTKLVYVRDDYKVVDQDIEMTTQASKHIISFGLYVVDNVSITTNSRDTEDQFPMVNTNMQETIIRQALLYILAIDTVHVFRKIYQVKIIQKMMLSKSAHHMI